MRKILTAIFAWATLVGGAGVLNALTALLVRVVLHKLSPDAPEATFWKTLAVIFSLASPIWVLAILKWFMESRPEMQA